MAPKYEQHYRKQWENLPEYKGWLRAVESDSTRAYCVYCKSDFYAKLTDLKKHSLTAKHKKSSDPFVNKSQRLLPFTKQAENKSNAAEAGLAMYIAAHSSFLTCDHLSLLCKSKFHDSKAATDLKIHRTKCTGVVKNIIAPHFIEELRTDIGDSPFSLIIDESTDISVMKLLGVVVRYFSVTTGRTISTFCSLITLEAGTAVAIVSALVNLMKKLDLNHNNLVGIGVDNASVNTGINNGVIEIMKRELNLPHLHMIRCVCHSLQLALSSATEKTVPRCVDYLVRETYNWFSHSTKRQLLYKGIYCAINNGEEPLKIPRVCDTRWISLEPPVTRILQQWLELETHFEIVRASESCYAAEMLYQMYSDVSNKLYLTYLKPILVEVQRVNKSFQSEIADPTKLLEDLSQLLKSISKRVTIPTRNVDPLTMPIRDYVDPKPYLGYEFEKLVAESTLSQEGEKTLRDRCVAFTVELCNELRNRLPTNLTLLEKVSTLSAQNCLRQVKQPIVDLAEQFGFEPGTIDGINTQWNNIALINWDNKKSTLDFWAEVNMYRDATGSNPFQDLLQLAMKVLSLPHSNAEVERVFSQLNLVKSKIRNRLSTETVCAILTVRSGLKRAGKCCHDYQLPGGTMKKIGTMEAYNRPSSSVEADDREDDIDILIDI